MSINIAELNEAIAAIIPDREAIVFRDRRFSYAELNERSRRLANFLLSHGVTLHKERAELENWESGQDHVALYMYNGNEYPECLLGTLKSRSVPVNINYRYVEEELLHVMKDADVKVIIYHGCFADKVAAISNQLNNLSLLIQVEDGSNVPLLPGAIEYESALASASSSKPTVTLSPDDLYMIYTGGTTGMPKGVLWRQGDFLVSMLGMKDKNDVPISDMDLILAQVTRSRGSSALSAPPYMHGTGQLISFVAWHNGNTVVIQDNVKHLDAAELLRVAEREQVRTLAVVGDAFALPIMKEMYAHEYDLSSLRLIVSSGAIFSRPVKDKILAKYPQITIVDALGSSETGPQGHNLSKGTDKEIDTKFKLTDGGVALNAEKTALAKPDDTDNGWFAVRGRIPLGYLNAPEKTQETFPVIDGERYSVPGDRVKIHECGNIEFLGRDSMTINSGGEKIFAEEVEQALKHHADVVDVIVSSRPSERFGNEVVAIVQTTRGNTDLTDELKSCASEHIARYKLPKAFVFVEEVMRGENGKADYRWAKSIAEQTVEGAGNGT
ncbi:MAG: AMP-binding protein [Sneathiella sp.]